MAGEYILKGGAFDLDLTWDAEQVLLLDGYTDISDVEKALRDSLVREVANIKGE